MKLTKEQLLSNADAIVAFANGDPIEFFSSFGSKWSAIKSLSGIETTPHRRAPKPKPVHGYDASNAEQRDQRIAAVHARNCGLPVEFVDYDGRWKYYPATLFSPGWRYRPAPQPATRKWSKPSDVPAGCWIREEKVSDAEWSALTAIDSAGVATDENYITWADLFAYYYHSTDLKTWKPCTVTE